MFGKARTSMTIALSNVAIIKNSSGIVYPQRLRSDPFRARSVIQFLGTFQPILPASCFEYKETCMTRSGHAHGYNLAESDREKFSALSSLLQRACQSDRVISPVPMRAGEVSRMCNRTENSAEDRGVDTRFPG